MTVKKDFKRVARNPELEKEDKYGATPLMQAIGEGKNRIEEILGKGADVNNRGSRLRLPLYSAITWGDDKDPDYRRLDVLLEAGADPNLPHVSDGHKIYPLSAAINKNAPSVFAKLLDYDADPRMIRTKANAVHDIITESREPFFAVFCEHYLAKHPEKLAQVVDMIDAADISARTKWAFRDILSEHFDMTPYTPVDMKPETVELRRLVEHGDAVDVQNHLDRFGYDDTADEQGRTPLHLAAAKGAHRTILVLLEAGAAANAKDKIGFTPLDTLIEHGHDNALAEQFLRDAGGDCARVRPGNDLTMKKKSPLKLGATP